MKKIAVFLALLLLLSVTMVKIGEPAAEPPRWRQTAPADPKYPQLPWPPPVRGPMSRLRRSCVDNDAYCRIFIRSVMNNHPLHGTIVCIPVDVANDQIADLFVGWADGHPQDYSGSAFINFMTFLHDTFPCLKVQPPSGSYPDNAPA